MSLLVGFIENQSGGGSRALSGHLSFLSNVRSHIFTLSIPAVAHQNQDLKCGCGREICSRGQQINRAFSLRLYGCGR
jgi:hypothetical protein